MDPSAADRAAYADAEVVPFWLDDLPGTDPEAPLEGAIESDLAIVGGGFTGLWAALHEKTRDLSVALEEHEVEWLREDAEQMRGYGHDVEVLDREQVRAEVSSPTYL